MEDTQLAALTEEIVRCLHPRRILLFSRKQGLDGGLSSVKLCVVADGESSRRMEHDIYLQVESALPFDVLCYRTEDWERLSRAEGSFAERIRRTGRLLYEK